MSQDHSHSAVPFGEAVRTWAKIGLLSFGGPAGQIALMHKIVVDEKRWVDEDRFLHALNFCMLLPGPEAQQLATYIGWLLHGVRGGLVAGLLFILPGALTILCFGIAYARFSDLALIQGLFLGIKAGVLAIVVEAFIKITRRVVKDRMSAVLAAGAFIALFMFAVPFPLVILAAAVIGALRVPGVAATSELQPKPELSKPWPRWQASVRTSVFGLTAWLLPIALLWFGLGPHHVLTELAAFFAQVAVITFGGAYAILTYVAQHVVQVQGWLSPGEMLDGLGLAETTPGPLILVLEFVGFLAGFKSGGALNPYAQGVLGAIVVLWVTFAPCFLWIFVGAPYIERLRAHTRLSTILASITAAVGGVILNLSLWFAIHTLFRATRTFEGFGLHLTLPQLDTLVTAAAAISALGFVTLFVFRWGTLATLAIAGVAGIAVKLFVL